MNNKKRKAVIIDPYSKGSYHEVINQGYLMMISMLYDEVEYIADETSCNNIQDLLRKCDICTTNIFFNKKKFRHFHFNNPGINHLVKLVEVSIIDFYYYIKRKRDEDCFFNNNLYFAAVFIQYLAFWKSNRIFDMCHSELEYINRDAAKSTTQIIIHHFFKILFTKYKIDQRFTFILLSESMANNFKSCISDKNANRIKWIDHCYIRPKNSICFNENITKFKGIRIGIPGAITPSRGLGLLERILAKRSLKKYTIFSLSFMTEKIKDNNLVVLNNTNRLVPFEEYNSNVQQMDFLLFLYPLDSYYLTASGAILEAIWNEKPVLALRNHYFDYMFRKFGSLGYLFNDEEELLSFLDSVEEIYLISEEIKENLRKAKISLLPSNVCSQLKSITICN